MTMTTPITIGDTNLDLCEEIPAGCVLPDLSDEEWWRTATEEADNGIYTLRRWQLDESNSLYVWSEQGHPYFTAIRQHDMVTELRDCDYDCDLAEHLAGYGYDGKTALTVATDDYTGPCRVWREPQYYHGTCNAPGDQFARDDNGEILEFASKEDAQGYVDHYYSAPSGYDGILACNVLSHGQAGADILTIVQA